MTFVVIIGFIFRLYTFTFPCNLKQAYFEGERKLYHLIPQDVTYVKTKLKC